MNEEYFMEKDILRINSKFLKKDNLNNQIQNNNNFCIEGNDKKCIVF